MAGEELKGFKVAFLATDGYEQSELTEPRKFLDAAGAGTEVISPKAGKAPAAGQIPPPLAGPNSSA